KVIVFGLSLFAASLWLTSKVTAEWGFWELLGPQALRGAAIMLCIVPSVTLALGGFAAAELRYASALFNLMRTLGGAIGIAMVNTWLADQTRIHVARFGEGLGQSGARAPDFVAAVAARISERGGDVSQALLSAQAEFARFVGRQATTFAFEEVFRL